MIDLKSEWNEEWQAQLRVGDANRGKALYSLVYDDLRERAHHLLRARPNGGDLQTTALVHEAWLRFSGKRAAAAGATDRPHFLRIATRAMRYVLVDEFRARQTRRRGGERTRVDLTSGTLRLDDEGTTLLDLNEALTKLRTVDERLADVAELKLFGGLAHEEIATAAECSVRTVEREWRLAKSWLQREMERGAAGG